MKRNLHFWVIVLCFIIALVPLIFASTELTLAMAFVAACLLANTTWRRIETRGRRNHVVVLAVIYQGELVGNAYSGMLPWSLCSDAISARTVVCNLAASFQQEIGDGAITSSVIDEEYHFNHARSKFSIYLCFLSSIESELLRDDRHGRYRLFPLGSEIQPGFSDEARKCFGEIRRILRQGVSNPELLPAGGGHSPLMEELGV